MQVTDKDFEILDRALASAEAHQAITGDEADRLEILVQSLSDLLNQLKGYNK